MSTRINSIKGNAGVIKTAPKQLHLDANKEIIIGVGSIAFLAISSLLAGGILLCLKVNTIYSWSLVGGGGGALIMDALVGGALFYMCNRKAKDSDYFLS